MPRSTHARIDELKSNGLKATVPRLKVMQILRDTRQRHLSAEDVYRELLGQHSEVALATVYRVLMQFVQAGLIERRTFEGGRAVFELNEGRHHDHLVCIRCGLLEEFVDARIEERQRAVARERGFELQEHAMALYGVCSGPRCRSAG